MAASIMDLWKHTSRLFTATPGEQPEIYIFNLSEEAMREVVEYIVCNSRDIEASFFDFYEVQQIVHSVTALINGLQSGDIMGEIWCDLHVEGYSLPSLGFYSDEPGFIVIDYVMGDHWNPVRVTALFEFFRMIKLWDHNAIIRINPRYFGKPIADQFDRVFEAYLHETK